MEVILLLLFVSLIVAVSFLIIYIMSARDGQFDDLYSPGQRILYDQDENKSDNLK